jgi:predicted DNA-binding protein
VNNPSDSNFYQKDYLVDSAIEAANEELPDYSEPSVTSLKMVKEGNNVVYSFKINNMTELLDENTAWELSLVNKQEMLADAAVEQDQDIINVMNIFFDGGYNVCYRYLNANGDILYNVIINGEEYNNALNMGASFKCDEKAYQSLLDYYTSLLPVEYMGDAVLLNIQHSTNALTYYVQLPEMSEYDLIFFDQKYLKEYVVENWETLDDNLKTLAKLNGEEIVYRFFTSDGDEHCVVTLTKEDYLIFE